MNKRLQAVLLIIFILLLSACNGDSEYRFEVSKSQISSVEELPEKGNTQSSSSVTSEKNSSQTASKAQNSESNISGNIKPNINVESTKETIVLEKKGAYKITKGEDEVDYIADFYKEKIKILQLTDIQLQNTYGARNEVRKWQIQTAFFQDKVDNAEIRAWQYVDEAINASRPDIIVLTGDSIYGELDDIGRMWLELCEKLDSYKIPWLIVFGNHDNESGKGVMWQIEQLEKSEYCIFSRGTVTGNSNYSVLIKANGEEKFMLYLLDTNGCRTIPSNPGEGLMSDNVDIAYIEQKSGIYSDQLDWMEYTAECVNEKYDLNLPSLLFYHIPSGEAREAVEKHYPNGWNNNTFIPNKNGDSGIAKENYMLEKFPLFWETAKKISCKGMFVGHQHLIATSIKYDGIRITYGLKTGTYDYHSSDMLGATEILLDTKNFNFNVEYLFSKIDYSTNIK